MKTKILLFLCALVASAQIARPPQPPPFTSVPSIEDRNLYHSFLAAQQKIFAANQAAKAANPGTAAQIDQQTAATLHITVPELTAVANLIQQASQSYDQIPAWRQALVTNPKYPTLTTAQLDGIDDFRRLGVTSQAVFALAKQLSPSSWTGLHNYIITTFKNSLSTP